MNEWNRLPDECVNATSVNNFMSKNKIDNYFKRSEYAEMWAIITTGHSISHWLPCPLPSWVPNIIGTWGGNSVKMLETKLGHYMVDTRSIIHANIRLFSFQTMSFLASNGTF